MSSSAVYHDSCCGRIQRSTPLNYTKEACLQITTALAIIALTGAVLGILAQQGIQLAEINSLASMIGGQNLYLTALVGASVICINTLLFTAYIHSLSYKQFSQRELSRIPVERENQAPINIMQWIQRNQLDAQLERGDFVRFPPIPAERATEGNAGHPAVYGIVCKNNMGQLEVYSYRKAGACEDKIRQLCYQEQYPKRQVESLRDTGYDEWKLRILVPDTYAAYDIQLDEEKTAYALKMNNNGTETFLFFASEAVRSARCQNLINIAEIETEISKAAAYTLLEENTHTNVNVTVREREFFGLYCRDRQIVIDISNHAAERERVARVRQSREVDINRLDPEIVTDENYILPQHENPAHTNNPVAIPARTPTALSPPPPPTIYKLDFINPDTGENNIAYFRTAQACIEFRRAIEERNE